MSQETKHDGWDPYSFESYIDYVEEAVMQDQVVMDHKDWINNMITKKTYEHAVRRKARLMDKSLSGDLGNPPNDSYSSDYTFSIDEF